MFLSQGQGLCRSAPIFVTGADDEKAGAQLQGAAELQQVELPPNVVFQRAPGIAVSRGDVRLGCEVHDCVGSELLQQAPHALALPRVEGDAALPRIAGLGRMVGKGGAGKLPIGLLQQVGA